MSILSLLNYLIHRLGMLYVRTVCAREYNNQTFSGVNERPVEFTFLFRHLVAFWPKNILDVGTGMTSLPHLMRTCGFHVTATDNIKDYWPSGMMNRHYHVINDDITCTKLDSTSDVITCISVLEHIQNHRRAMQTLYKLLNPGGRLILTCPFNEEQYVPNVYALPESAVWGKSPFVTQAFSRCEIEIWMQDNPFEVVEQEYW